MAKKFSANEAAQPVYTAIHKAVKDLSQADAVAVLEEIASHAEAMAEGIRSEMDDDNE